MSVASSDLSFDLELLADGSGGNTNANTNLPPTVQLVTPSDGTVFNVPANIRLFANANDPNGYLTLKYVEFFEGANSLGIRTNFPTLNPLGPFVLQWTSVPVGEYTLTAVAVDDHAAKTTSAPVRILVRSTPPPETSTLIASNSVWKYLDNGTDLGAAWRAPGFDDSSWASGPGQLGYGDGDEATAVSFGPDSANKYITTYFRRAFDVADVSSVGNLVLRVLRDDGVAVYLNGVEVFRNNLPAEPISFNSPASSVAADESAYLEAPIASMGLVAGRNVIAAEVHQANPTSSDLSFDLALLANTGPLPPANQPPVVSILAPANGATFSASTNILLGAHSEDPDGGTLPPVEFFANGASLGRADGPFRTPQGEWLLTWFNAPSGNHTLTAVATDDRGAKGTSAPVRITVEGEPPSGDRELHVVGIYSGAAVDGGPVRNNEVGDAAVSVDRNGRRVTLYLASYEPTRWHVSVAPGTSIERVFTSSAYSNTLIGLPAGVPVITTRLGFAGYSLDSAQYLRALPHLCADTGQDLSSFHGSYSAPYPAPFVIDGVQNDPRLRCDYPQPVPTNNLPPINFRLAFHGSGRGLFFQNYTLAGLQGAFDLLPDVLAVPDSGARFYYAADPHFVWKIDGQSGDVRNMELPPTVPMLSWPVGVAFDSLRERALLVSLGGEGFLYAYSPGADAWRLVSSMNNRDLDSLVYHAPLDSLFGVGNPHSSDAPALHEFGPDGLPRRTIPLPNQPQRIVQGSVRSELVSVGDYLVLLLGPRYRGDTDQEQRMYLIDPRTGEVWLTYRRIGPPPNSPPVVTITSPPNDAVFSTEETVSLTVSASDPGGAIASVEFFLNGDSQGNASGPNGSTQGTWHMQLSDLLPGTHRFTARATDNLGAMTTSSEVTFGVQPLTDSDGDGVPDGRDLCPNTEASVVVNADGCSLAQLCPCDGGWQNHGEYVRCVIDHAWQFFRAGLITADQRRAAIRNATDSDCGRHPPAVEPMQMHLLPLTPAECHAGGMQFVVSGDASGECVIETSTDLINWTPVQAVPTATVGCEVACPNSASSGSEPARFFRVRSASL